MNSAEVLSSDLDLVRRSLLVQKSEILNKHMEFKNLQHSSAKATDEADAVVQDLQDNLNIQLHERDQFSLLLIDKALSKFADGTYGLCECCADVIDVRRLKARPLATLCIACMEDQEAPGKHLFQ
ncbi:MAG: TraR/DksA family transcriptional regulator [Bdellovibrio sp.]|nr:TraR/DksA family transcriptional regulator [Bdellovibrio sp.]